MPIATHTEARSGHLGRGRLLLLHIDSVRFDIIFLDSCRARWGWCGLLRLDPCVVRCACGDYKDGRDAIPAAVDKYGQHVVASY